MYSKKQAIALMNDWGGKRIPFLFIIDFEMQSIMLFPANNAIPDYISFVFPDNSWFPKIEKSTDNFIFNKYPIDFSIYTKAFQEVLQQINEGNSFLLNLTFPTRIETELSLKDIFNKSSAKYKLLVDNQFVVFSPETFVTIKNGQIFSYPMKGTINASVLNAEKIILENEKETAEHYTIVDLIRNDLSMVAVDVEVTRFRYIDNISTNLGNILQVSSEISGTLPENYYDKLGDILFTLLPAGSVTGAPKPRTIEIIKKVEGDNRGYYTGVFGFFDGSSLDSAVMIRFIEQRDDSLWYRSGGGLTFLSNLHDEYNELIDKVYVPIT